MRIAVFPFSFKTSSIVGLTHHLTLDQPGDKSGGYVLFFCVRARVNIRVYTCEPKQKTGRGVVKRARQAARFKLSRIAEALDAITVWSLHSLSTDDDGVIISFPDRGVNRCWILGAVYVK